MGMRFIIDTSIWDGKKILDTSIYDGQDSETSLHIYEISNPLKNLRSTLVLGTKELSLLILGIIVLCLWCFFVQELNAVKSCCLFAIVFFCCLNNLWLFYKYVYIIFYLILQIPWLDFSGYRAGWEQHYLRTIL